MEVEESDKTTDSPVNANGAAKGTILHTIHNIWNLYKQREEPVL